MNAGGGGPTTLDPPTLATLSTCCPACRRACSSACRVQCSLPLLKLLSRLNRGRLIWFLCSSFKDSHRASRPDFCCDSHHDSCRSHPASCPASPPVSAPDLIQILSRLHSDLVQITFRSCPDLINYYPVSHPVSRLDLIQILSRSRPVPHPVSLSDVVQISSISLSSFLSCFSFSFSFSISSSFCPQISSRSRPYLILISSRSHPDLIQISPGFYLTSLL